MRIKGLQRTSVLEETPEEPLRVFARARHLCFLDGRSAGADELDEEPLGAIRDEPVLFINSTDLQAGRSSATNTSREFMNRKKVHYREKVKESPTPCWFVHVTLTAVKSVQRDMLLKLSKKCCLGV